MAADDIKVVVFSLENDGAQCEYGIPIHQVHEINRVGKITKLPEVPDFIEGILDLRGIVIPVIDMKKRFKLGKIENQDTTRIMVVTMDGKKVGIIVDDVLEILSFTPKEISEPPKVFSSISSRYITGIGNMDERLVTILDIEKILAEDERVQLTNAV